MAEKRYWWLKLQEDFFRQKAIKKLRKLDRGTTYTIIYLKMQLASLRNNGVLVFERFEDSFAEELADELDEDVADVSETVDFLLRYGLLVQLSEAETYLPEAVKNSGSEVASAKRVRELRRREKEGALQCNDRALHCYGEKIREDKKRGDIEKEKEKEPKRERKPDAEEEGEPEGETGPRPAERLPNVEKPVEKQEPITDFEALRQEKLDALRKWKPKGE